MEIGDLETFDLNTVNTAAPVVLPCVDGTSITIVRARRVHHVKNDHGTWDYTSVILVTADGEEAELDEVSDLLHFNYVQSEIANATFRVLDEPSAGLWLITASQLLKLVAAAAVEHAEEPKAEVIEAD